VDGDGGDGGWLRALDETLRAVLRDTRVWLGVLKVPGQWSFEQELTGHASSASVSAEDGTQSINNNAVQGSASGLNATRPNSKANADLLSSILHRYGVDEDHADADASLRMRHRPNSVAPKLLQGGESKSLCTVAAFHAFGRLYFTVYHQRAAVWRVIATLDDDEHVAALLLGTPDG